MKRYIINLMTEDIERMKAHRQSTSIILGRDTRDYKRICVAIIKAEKHLEKVKSHNIKFVKP